MAKPRDDASDKETLRERRCIATGEVKPAASLIRFVIGPEGDLVPDLRARLPGRGIWVSADRKALETAAKKNLFAKAAGQPVKVPADLPDRVEQLLTHRVGEILGLTRRAGLILNGFGKVEAALKDWRQKVIALIEASDGAEDGRRKLAQTARSADRDVDVVTGLLAKEMGLAMGHELVVHAALLEGGLSRSLLAEIARLQGVRAEPRLARGAR
jgi:predicted RNA-binding protein YlxR (DUF448 family)